VTREEQCASRVRRMIGLCIIKNNYQCKIIVTLSLFNNFKYVIQRIQDNI